jgi:4-amino-4-deoxy-L-arabinose transferase-like glycosyltransferase
MKPILKQVVEVTAPVESARRETYGRPGAIAGLVVICAFAFLFGLGRLSLVGPDEPRFAEAGREMFETGDYISPRVAGVVAFDKPALLYWGMAASYHVLGVSEFAARLPSALAALVCVLLLYHTIATTLTARLAFISSATLATSLLFLGLARAAITDMLFVSSLSAALLCLFLYAMKAGRERMIYLAASGAAVGLAVLAKGVVGLALFGAVGVASLVVTRRPDKINWRDLLIWVAICLAVISVWYVPVTIKHGHAFVDDFIIKHHFKRFTSNYYKHPQPVWFYIPLTIAGLLPWAAFLIPAAARLRRIKPRARNTADYLLAIAWVWFAVIFIFFSLSQSKLPSYILPAFPALAIIVGVEVERVWDGARDTWLNVAAWLTVLILAIMPVGFVLYLKNESLVAGGVEWLAYSIPLAIAVVTAVSMAMNKRRAVVIGATAVVITLIITAVEFALPRLDERIGLKGLSLAVASALRPGERMAFYHNKNYAPVFYAEGRAVSNKERGEGLNAYSLEEILSSLEAEGTLVVITNSSNENDLTQNPRFESEAIAAQGSNRALRVWLASSSPESQEE